MKQAEQQKPIRVGVAGVFGRMGRLLVDEVAGHPRFILAEGTARTGTQRPSSFIDGNGASHAVTTAFGRSGALDVVIDFTSKEALPAHVAFCVSSKTALLVGTTGLDDDTRRLLDAAASEIPLLVASNTSLGANWLMHLAKETAQALDDVDIEIVELHHNKKRDAPSGTALSLTAAVRDGRTRAGRTTTVLHGRAGIAPRGSDDVTVLAVRGGDVVGEHTVYAFGVGERIELTHRVTDRRVFARGALTAAGFLVGKNPGRYSMADVFASILNEDAKK